VVVIVVGVVIIIGCSLASFLQQIATRLMGCCSLWLQWCSIVVGVSDVGCKLALVLQ